jgi:hypothetical protein
MVLDTKHPMWALNIRAFYVLLTNTEYCTLHSLRPDTFSSVEELTVAYIASNYKDAKASSRCRTHHAIPLTFSLYLYCTCIVTATKADNKRANNNINMRILARFR